MCSGRGIAVMLLQNKFSVYLYGFMMLTVSEILAQNICVALLGLLALASRPLQCVNTYLSTWDLALMLFDIA